MIGTKSQMTTSAICAAVVSHHLTTTIQERVFPAQNPTSTTTDEPD